MSESATRLEPYLIIARSTKGAAAAKVIKDVVGAAGVFSFAELLDMPNVQELKTSDNPALVGAYKLLELFAYGTFEEYTLHQAEYGDLSPAQATKLKQLSLVSLGMTSRSLPYPHLLQTLQLPSPRALEDLIIDSIYAGLLAGKLSSRDGGVFHVDSVLGRDVDVRERGEGSGSKQVGAMDLEDLRSRLENWCTMTNSLLSSIDAKITDARAQSTASNLQTQAFLTKRDAMLNKLEKQSKDPKKKDEQGFGGGWSTGGGGGGSGGGRNTRSGFGGGGGAGGTPRKDQRGRGGDFADDRGGEGKGKGRR